jgi:predicted PurR-regulated permease PerM
MIMPFAKKPIKVEITPKTIIFTVFFLLGLAFLYQVRNIILFLFIAVILMTALNPLIDWLEQYKVSRGISTIIVYVLLWLLISVSVASLVPALAEETGKFVDNLPGYLNRLLGGRFNLAFFEPQLQSLPQNAFRLIIGAFNNVVSLFTLLVIVYYLILERRNLHKYLLFLFGNDDREARAEAFINRLEKRLGGWVRGQLLLMFFVGMATYIGLLFLGIDYAVPLAFLAGILEIVPNIGPTLAALPAVLVALGNSPLLALAAAALYFVIQQLESSFIVPRVMSKAVGLSPLIVIVSLLIGLKLAGIAGAILSIPAVLLLETFLAEFKKR